MKTTLILVFFILIAPKIAPAQVDVLVGKNGEKFMGTLIEQNESSVVFESELAGRITLPLSGVHEIQKGANRSQPAPTPLVSDPAKSSDVKETSGALPPVYPGPMVDDKYDWIKLDSGEWLKGYIKNMQRKKLEFDSDELDIQVFDWVDVLEVRSPRPNTVQFNDRSTVIGKMQVSPDSVKVIGDTVTEYPRGSVFGIMPGEGRELDFWSAKMSTGLSFRSGNTDQTEVNAQVDITRRTPDTRLTLSYIGNYGEADGSETANNHRGTAQFNYFLTRKFYLVVPFVEYYQDKFQNLDQRITLGAGVGYDFFATDRVDWTVWAAPAFQRSRFLSVTTTGDREKDDGALIVGTKSEIELNKYIDWNLQYNAQVKQKDSGGVTHHALTGLEFELTRYLDFEVSLMWDRVQYPQERSDGSIPSQDDLRLMFGLALDI